VAGGISERSGEMPEGHFAYSVLCEVASDSERRAEPELFPKPLCRKGASDPTDRREGGGASDFGITYPCYTTLRRPRRDIIGRSPSRTGTSNVRIAGVM